MPDAPDAMPPYRPEQQLFSDPVIDRLMAVTMTLAAEVYILRERIGDLESRLAGDDSSASGTPAGERSAQAAAFAAHVLGPLLGEQQSRGPQ
ncbi:hypothetical protein GCM10025795_42800 [Verticiella sediminum]